MKGYIDNVLLKYGHTKQNYPQLTPHKHHGIKYGAKQELSPADYTSPTIDSAGIKNIQAIIGALLYYARAVNNKLLVYLSAIDDQHAASTEDTADATKKS